MGPPLNGKRTRLFSYAILDKMADTCAWRDTCGSYTKQGLRVLGASAAIQFYIVTGAGCEAGHDCGAHVSRHNTAHRLRGPGGLSELYDKVIERLLSRLPG